MLTQFYPLVPDFVAPDSIPALSLCVDDHDRVWFRQYTGSFVNLATKEYLTSKTQPPANRMRVVEDFQVRECFVWDGTEGDRQSKVENGIQKEVASRSELGLKTEKPAAEPGSPEPATPTELDAARDRTKIPPAEERGRPQLEAIKESMMFGRLYQAAYEEELLRCLTFGESFLSLVNGPEIQVSEVQQKPFTSNHNTDSAGNPFGGATTGTGFRIEWQRGPLRTPLTRANNRNGAFVEDLIEALIDRLRYYQSTKFKHRCNAVALMRLNQALESLRSRQREREERCVAGTHTV